MEDNKKTLISVDNNGGLQFNKLSDEETRKQFKPVVYKNNCIIQASGFQTANEIKLFIGLQYLARIDLEEDPEKKLFEIPLKNLIDLIWSKNTDFKPLKETLTSLMTNVITYNRFNNYKDEITRGAFPLLSRVEITRSLNDKSDNKNRVVFRFNDPILEVIKTPKKSSYTELNLMVISRLSGFYALTIYQLVKQAEDVIKYNWKITFTEDELKVLTNTQEKYKKFGMFKERVLEQAKAEINGKDKKTGERNTDIIITYNVRNTKDENWKKIKVIDFSFKENKNFSYTKKEEKSEEVETVLNNIVSGLEVIESKKPWSDEERQNNEIDILKAFSEIWSFRPRKQDEKKAKETFVNLLKERKDLTPEFIKERAVIYSEYVKQENIEFKFMKTLWKRIEEEKYNDLLPLKEKPKTKERNRLNGTKEEIKVDENPLFM